MGNVRLSRLRSVVAVTLQVCGIVSASIGAGLANLAAGLIVAGVSSVLFGVALERGDGIGESVQ